MQSKLFISSFMVGYLATLIPNKKSNIHPLISSAIFGLLFAKIVFGDWDQGLQFTYLDIVYGIAVIFSAVLGGLVSLLL
tara:strand:- start:1375 stop:1611 length:237 start_codon:yes stop_codon:yes gene_type:complete